MRVTRSDQTTEALQAVFALAGGAIGGGPLSLPERMDAVAITQLLARHRVTMLCERQWRALHAQGLAEAVPPEVAGAARSASLRALSAVAFLVALAKAFDDAGIRWMPLKGPVLAVQAHGHPAMRVARDLDVLVEPGRIADAVGIAVELGWRIAPDWQRVARLTGKLDLEMAPGQPGQPLLEVHCAIDAGRPGFLWHPLAATGERVVVGGYPMPVPDIDTLIAYIAWHGGRHFWFRLNWLVDLAALLRQVSDGEALIRRAREMGAEKSVRAGMLLAQLLLGIVPPKVPPPTRHMARASERLAGWGAARIRLDIEDRRVAARPWSFLWTLREWRVEDRPWRQTPSALASVLRPREPDVRRLGVGAPLALHLLARPFLLAGRVGADMHTKPSAGRSSSG